MAFRWRTDDGPLKKGIWILSLPSSTEKSCQSWSRLTPLLDACMEEVPQQLGLMCLAQGHNAVNPVRL